MKLSEAAKSLQSIYFGEDVRFSGCSTDSRKVNNGELFIALKGNRFDGHDFLKNAKQHGASAALVQKANEQYLPMIVVENTRHAMGKLAEYWRSEFDIPLVAITGSNGKTTVKEMLVNILRLQAPVLATQGNLNNDIGVPLTLFGLGNEHRYAVVEMGANHPGEIAWLSQIARPNVALITQCAPAHLEGFGSIEGVASAKAEIFGGLDQNGIAIINADDSYAEFWRDKITEFSQLSFGMERPADISAKIISQSVSRGRNDFVMTTPSGSIDISLPLLGRHNIINALAAAACAIGLNINLTLIKRGLENTPVVKGRLETKSGMNHSLIIDDTYNANPASLDAALNVISAFQGRHWLVLGDMGELGPESEAMHARAGKAARESGIEKLFATGPLSHAAVESFGDDAQHFADIKQLVENIQTDITSDVIVLVKGSRAMQMERVVKILETNN
ncbi:MAG: UDP-N-acetylmuramoyl-tripeptide--D-alanyl-D-alanine ligase [Gammaproteobacteria bacterium]|nr:UDP-N-acetylmuramoyl-tripeptide--D-alanyl-D-alanine ligase [Gammaproteobacteria bacterium]